MAQQANNPQREPSMDEILASIRRIIEESEPDRAAADLSAIERLTGETAAIGPAANDTAAPVESKATIAPPMRDAEAEMETELLSGSFDTDVLGLDPELESAFRQLEASHEEVRGSEVLSVEPEVAMPAPEPVLNTVLADAMTAASADMSRSIMSERTGRQVAASFGDLQDAFAASRRRSFDEVAEEMMRPMLRDWMDNNLPILVERLVREEIERVARGS